MHTLQSGSTHRAAGVHLIIKKVNWSLYCSQQMSSPPDLLYPAQIRFGDLGSLVAAISTLWLPTCLILWLKRKFFKAGT